MKYLILFLSCLVLSCSSNEENASAGATSTFDVTATPSATSITVDETVTIALAANETMKGLSYSLDNFATPVTTNHDDFGSVKTLYFNFTSLGQKTISIRIANGSGVEVTKMVLVNVTRGNALKITGLQVTTFDNINNTWDNEFGPTDPNRLADVFFALNKSQINYLNNNSYSGLWYKSVVKQNQGNLTWDLTAANLYINPNLNIPFGLADDEGNGSSQNLIPTFPDYKVISFANYISTKPTTINYSFPDANLSFTMTVEWAN